MARSAVAWLLLLAAGAALTGCGPRPAEGDEVWAEVNGRPIFRSQVEKYYERQVGLQPEPPTAQEALARKLAILTELIQNEILWQKAAQANLLATDGDVEARLAELRAPFSAQEFQQQLGAQGMTLDELKAELRREISIRKLLDKSLAAGLTVSDQEVTDFYEEHKNRFRFVETQYHVAQVLVTPRREPQVRNLKNDDATSDLEAQRKIQALVGRLRAGDDFRELARNYSEDPATALAGGDLGFFAEASLADAPAALRAAVQQSAVGQVTGPVRTPAGYHLLKLLEREEPGQRELSDPSVQQTIREQLVAHKRQLLEAAYIERARNQAGVANYLARQILESYRVTP